MRKQSENLIYQLVHSEYCDALKEWFNEMIAENDRLTRVLDPTKEPHKISKLAGGTETLLSIIHDFDRTRDGD